MSREANSELDSPLTLQELYAALQSKQGKKAPGIYGPTVEFYKAFWNILAQDILMRALCLGHCLCPVREPSSPSCPRKETYNTSISYLSPLHRLQNSVQSLGQETERNHGADSSPGPDVLCARQVYGR